MSRPDISPVYVASASWLRPQYDCMEVAAGAPVDGAPSGGAPSGGAPVSALRWSGVQEVEQ
jgi:hypothetical protein